MGDIIKIFSKIGESYLDDEKRIKNDAFKYDKIKVYLFDIENKNIDVSFNIPYDDLIITRFGVGSNSGALFPNIFFNPKNVKKDFDKFVRAILKANKNLLSYFTQDEIQKDNILKILKSIDKEFFEEKKEEIQKLDEYKKQKGEKGKIATYFSLSYKGKPISYYYKNIYNKHLKKSSKKAQNKKGYDILTNQEGIGGDANLAFCSTNELPKGMQSIKFKLLPLSHESARVIKIGFDVMDERLSHNFYGLKMAIMPTILDNKVEYKDILEILEKSNKGELLEIRESEVTINEYLEDVAFEENRREIGVLNTILFYEKNNSAINLLLQIDDILPSYISKISNILGEYNIKAFKDKSIKDTLDTIYLQNIFKSRLEIMNILLSNKKIDKDTLIDKLSTLIYLGTINKAYSLAVEWGKYFNNYYSNRTIDAINRYIMFFNQSDKLRDKFILTKEVILQESENIKEKIEKLIKNSEFLNNETLKSAYLLGMLSAALINWQLGVSGNSSYEKWLNNIGIISKDSLDRIWKKAEETIRKISSTSGKSNKVVNEVKNLAIDSLSKALIEDKIVKSSYVSLAFAMGGSDFTKYIKEKK